MIHHWLGIIVAVSALSVKFSNFVISVQMQSLHQLISSLPPTLSLRQFHLHPGRSRRVKYLYGNKTLSIKYGNICIYTWQVLLVWLKLWLVSKHKLFFSKRREPTLSYSWNMFLYSSIWQLNEIFNFHIFNIVANCWPADQWWRRSICLLCSWWQRRRCSLNIFGTPPEKITHALP